MPLMVALPELGINSVESMRTNVVLPAPFLPISANIPFVFIESFGMSSAAGPVPYLLVRFLHSKVFFIMSL